MAVNADKPTDKCTSQRITGVRVLTSNDYMEMMREKDRKVKEAAELKQRRKEERELEKNREGKSELTKEKEVGREETKH